MSTMQAGTTIVRGRCSGCRTPWSLNTITHQVTYGAVPRPGVNNASRPVAVTDHENGDDEWACPVIVDVVSPEPDNPYDDGIVLCGTAESHDADDEWGAWR